MLKRKAISLMEEWLPFKRLSWSPISNRRASSWKNISYSCIRTRPLRSCCRGESFRKRRSASCHWIGNEVNHCHPVDISEFRQCITLAQLVKVGFNLMPACRAFSDEVSDLGSIVRQRSERHHQRLIVTVTF